MAASRSFNQRTFEEYAPNVEWNRDAEAEAVRISLPGFKREEIRVLVDNHGHLRTRGERAIAGTGNRWSRFQKDFLLPDNCNVDGIRAKFENETLTITLPKKTPSPPSGPVTPQTPVPAQRPPPALAEPAARPAAPPTVPAATLAPAASKKAPAERRPSMARKPTPAPAPAPEEEPPKGNNGGGGASAATKPQSSPAAVTRPDQEEEERKRMEREAAGKMAEDTKATMQEKAKEQQGDEAVAAAMELASQPRPISATRGLLMNAVIAAALLIGITVYVWHTLRNATGGAGGHGHGHLGAGSYGDEM
ncbi:hypothetical protein BS78_01G138300 [Paspalum vaginatum]|nr:hypothetical protein BS78_01G138300 [Paspalum vaginatum]